MEKLTPMMQQYMEVKNQYPDALVMYRLGDFYELFFDDAKIASLELDLVLTGRSAGNNERAPMCGVPHHAVSSYVQRLVENGHKVCMVEQMEDPATAVGIVRRDVVKVVTPGTVLDEVSDDKTSIRIASLSASAGKYIAVMCELASGETQVLEFPERTFMLRQSLLKYNIRELVLPSDFSEKVRKNLRENTGITISFCDAQQIPEAYEENISEITDSVKRSTYGRLLQYLDTTQKRSLRHLQLVEDDHREQWMEMDFSTLQNLELVSPARTSSKSETLLSFLDQCQSSMGSRLLRKWIEQPLNYLPAIHQRQNQVTFLVENFMVRDSLRTSMRNCYDVERLIAKVAFGSANPQDCLRLQKTLTQLPIILDSLRQSAAYTSLISIDRCTDLLNTLNSALNENPPALLKDGGVFKEGYNATLDDYRKIQKSGKQWLLDFENQEKERTQIKNLRIGYNRVFGYYIEVSKGSVALIRDEFEYTRKQTLANAERYITPQLKEKEDAILHAEERSIRLETELFKELIDTITLYLAKLQKIAKTLANVDVIQALAMLSQNSGYVLPKFHEGRNLEILEGRHPILEAKTRYIPNNCKLSEETPIDIITGPNMGGKSTYMRQVALIIVLAQMGCYVPADKASLPLIDKIFTRMGASDDIMQGQSTFMVEMTEANLALQNATQDSMIFFDEIGRGTSTYDGMALAQAMLEYIATVVKCKTLFSTHYHELTNLDQSLPQIKNVHVEVHEEGESVTFLYRIKNGRSDRSYGVNVARLAKLPPAILQRANTLLKELESKKRVVQQTMEIVEMVTIPKPLAEIQESLAKIDPDNMTPMEALRYISEWKRITTKK